MRRRDPKLDRLKDFAPFSGCSPEHLRLVGRLADELAVQHGHVLMSEGRRSDHCFVVAVGQVAVSRARRPITTLGPGRLFGEVGVILEQPSEVTVTAVVDTRLLVVGRREFATLLDVPAFRRLILSGMASRIVQVDVAPEGRRGLALLPGMGGDDLLVRNAW